MNKKIDRMKENVDGFKKQRPDLVEYFLMSKKQRNLLIIFIGVLLIIQFFMCYGGGLALHNYGHIF